MGSGTFSAAASETGGGRAFRPGPRTGLLAAALAAIAVAVVLVLILAPGGSHPVRSHQVKAYGRLPTWLPKISNGSARLEVARPAAPVLGEAQGYTVHAEASTGSTDVTAAGPQIPSWVASEVQSGKWADGKPVPGTFVVTLADVKGTVPLAAGAFSILTDAGQIVHPKVVVKGGGPMPAALHAGEHINLDVTGGVTEGSGSIRWAPLGKRVLVGWIYQLELD